MTYGRTERLVAPDAGERLASMSALVDPGWTGIIEVLVAGLDGSVRWEPDLVVLQLPHHTHPDRVGDLEVLRLCLGLVGVPVLLDLSCVTLPDASLVEFLRKLAKSGLMVDVGRSAA